ncbi:MAG: hypothetical protein HY081_03735 [Gammaproteobacteria bacterium]|nr:hypothetical protein [Gammaproteobacteria bacterium]
MEYLSESTRLLYPQLLSQCLHNAAPSGRGLSFAAKRIKGGKHWYLQVNVGSRKTQHYLGPDTEAVRALIEKEKSLWASAATDLHARENLVSMLVSGGAHTVSAVEARLFELLERAGVFLAGGVLVGSHAFAVYGNMLGVKWASETTRTQDVDIAAAYRLLIGMPDRQVNLRQALMESELGFIEVPALDRKSPSTRFRIKGKQLSVDILTPMVGRTSAKPIHLAALDTYAEPVRFLDYLLADAQPAILVARAGILMNVPSPARYALHKLVTSERRMPAFQTKTKKDVYQAQQLISALLHDRPGDLRRAWNAAAEQPSKFMQQLRAGLSRLSKETRAELMASVARKRK